jgi:WS/DGAT/MGAT family acyltransferase
MERMSTLDAGFYYVEHANVPMHIGSLAVFEGPAPAYPDLLALYEAKLPRVRRYRQVVRTMPLQVFRPFWADDQHFDLRYHLRHTAVPPPGGPEQLMTMAARIIAQRLDRARPLWEAWFLEGIEGGRWGIISKVHHCMVDGIGGSDLMAELFAPEAEPSTPRTGASGGRSAAASRGPESWRPEPGPSVAEMIGGGLIDAARWPIGQLSALPGFVRQSLGTPAELLRFGLGLTGSARRLATQSAASLNGPIGPHRRWRWKTADLTEVRQIRSSLGVTINDVILAAITSGFRDLLDARGELADGIVVRSLVPVSVRDDAGGRRDGDGQGGDGQQVSNNISAVLVNLPVSVADPGTRLALLHEQMDDLKSTKQAVGAALLTELLGFAAPTLLALGSRAAFRISQPLVQTVTTNVPGPRVPLFLLGRQMLAAYPYVPIGNGVRIGVAIFSYLNSFSFGITADYDSASDADLEVLTAGIQHGLADLADLAGRARAAATRARRKKSASKAAATKTSATKTSASKAAATKTSASKAAATKAAASKSGTRSRTGGRGRSGSAHQTGHDALERR